MASLKKWWIGKYKLPATHALFQRQSIAELTLEMFEDMRSRKAELEQELTRARPSEQGELIELLQSIQYALGEREKEPQKFEDELVAKWERIIEEGGTPDLDEAPASES